MIRPFRFPLLSRVAWLAAAAAGFALVPASAGSALRSGPMLGPLEMREAKVWVQTTAPAVVRAVYADGEGAEHVSAAVETRTETAHTATLVLDQVEPGRAYTCTIEIDGAPAAGVDPLRFETPEFYHDRTPPPNFTVAVVSGHYVPEEGFEPPYEVRGGGYSIFDSILAAAPDLMIWLGDTLTLRESDWRTRSGYLKRHTHARALPEMAPLLAAVPQYAIWGGTDYGPEGAGRYYTQRAAAEDAFRAFWPAPSAPLPEGLAARFRHADADFFLLDVRTHRDDRPDASRLPVILGREQIEWLRQELLLSDATFKVIMAGAPILNPAENPQNLSFADREHTDLMQILREEKLSGLVFLSGGKAYGELTRVVHAKSYNLYGLTTGPVTANPDDGKDELNFFRVPGTSSFERNFALLEFTGPEENRTLTLRVLGIEGNELWSRKIRASQLQSVD